MINKKRRLRGLNENNWVCNLVLGTGIMAICTTDPRVDFLKIGVKSTHNTFEDPSYEIKKINR
ncbi:hypothetical protein BpHYR1_047365 [Brachionus plicatilis]|uniref:Uncharacterized protein n=1 Tax=Brachionus plicatilis TaxID=10195 RepID=A0A3M7RUK6_BRAPC|nr:hypothetical protein BpHYR1_047365 [Brachionus plicatilis]